MIKSTDVKIGNYIQGVAHILIVDKYIIENIVDNPKHPYKPITLSIDWLKKAGYKQLKCINKTYSLGNFEDNSAIFVSGEKFAHINTGTRLDYVHELQNLHSCLFKKELKFN